MKMLLESPQIEIDSTRDGVWLHFKSSTGLHLSMNLDAHDGDLIGDRCLRQCAEDYRKELRETAK